MYMIPFKSLKKKIKDNTERSLRDLLQTKVEKQKSRGKKKQKGGTARLVLQETRLYICLYMHMFVCVYIYQERGSEHSLRSSLLDQKANPLSA